MPDGRPDDPFVDPADPDAIARERRRQEREDRRREREARQAAKEERQATPSPPPEPVLPPAPPRTPEEEFWEEPPAQPTAPAPPTAAASARPGGVNGGRRMGSGKRFAIAAALVAMGVPALAIAALAQRYFDEEPAPQPAVVYRTITVTIPEGLSRAQTAELAREEGLKGDYLKASKGHEGFLFPDTYELEKSAPVTDLVQLQLETFKRRMQGVDLSYARSKNLTLEDVVTIASMVEREAMLDSERKLVAAVIYNRLSDGMPLGIDATIRFATGNYTQPLTESELAVDSPYNTRLNTGLPPGPIGSPGLASLEAAARPAKVDYLFYVVKPGTCGEHAFSSDEVQFQADVARYNEAREAAGGQSPDSC